MLNLFGKEPDFVAPPIQIYVGTTYIKLRANSKNGNIGNGISLAPFMKQHLQEREWVPRFKSYVTTYKYSGYDHSTGMAIMPRYALPKLLQYLGDSNVEIVNIAPVTPRKIKLKMKRRFSPRDNQKNIIDFMCQEGPYRPVSAQTGIGKALPNSTPIQTPHGWITHGEVAVGDTVIAWDGTTSVVDGVFPLGERSLFRISFSDGRFINADGDHLWTVLYYEQDDITNLKSKAITTIDLVEYLNDPWLKHKTFIPLNMSVISEDVELPIPPYAMGLYLGGNIQLLTPFDLMQLKSLFGNLNEPAIPGQYLISSHEQRMDLLRGILDSGGFVNGELRNIYDGNSLSGGIQYSTTSHSLAICLQYLVRSIGGMCGIQERNSIVTEEGRVILKNSIYELQIQYTYPSLLFENEAKRDLVSNINNITEPMRLRIVSVEPLPYKEECTCISIDHPDQLYVTKDFIITHNTFCSEAAICRLGVPTFIILNSLISQWYKSLRTHIDIASHDIYVVQGYETLRKLWEAIKNGYRPKIVIFSTRTLMSYAVNPSDKYAELPSYAKLQEILKPGLKIFDEVHREFYANTQIDMRSNIEGNIYLSATYQRSNYQGGRIFDMIYPKELRFGEQFFKKYTTVHMLSYTLGIPQIAIPKFRTNKGYNHALYEKLIRKNTKFFNCFMDEVIIPVVKMYYLNVKKPDQRLLILTQTKKFAIALEKSLRKHVGKLNMKVYFSGDRSKLGNDSNLLADIIVSTHKSCGTGRDIKLLKTCINTVSFASEPLTGQVMGRLRELPGDETIFVDIWNSEINSHYNHYRERMEVYKIKALKYFESNIS